MNQLQQIGTERIPVLLEETSRVIEHDPGEMIQPERRVYIRFRFQVIPMASVSFVYLGQHCLIRPLGKFRLLVDQCHDVQLFDSYQIESVLIVDELYVLPIYTLVVVFLLLELEYMLDEELLQILIRVVDAKLFEAVVTEIFETEYVQYAYGAPRRVLRPVNCFVYFLHDVHE